MPSRADARLANKAAAWYANLRGDKPAPHLNPHKTRLSDGSACPGAVVAPEGVHPAGVRAAAGARQGPAQREPP